MGKRTVTELLDTKVEFVSFVDEGANGQEFAIYKSKDYKVKEKEKNREESITMNAEEASFLMKFFNFIKSGFVKDNKEEDMDLEKIMDAINGLSETIKGIDGRITSIEDKIKKDAEGGDDETGEDTGTDAGGDTGADDGDGGDNEEGADTGEDAGDTSGDGDGEGSEEGGDGNVAKGKDKEDGNTDNQTDAIGKAVGALVTSVEQISKRIDNIEKFRLPSKSADGDETPKPTEKSVFAGMF